MMILMVILMMMMLQDEPEASTPVCWEKASRAKIAASQADRELSQVIMKMTLMMVMTIGRKQIIIT